MSVVNLLLTVVAWALIEVLLLVLFRIARFYQLTSGQVSHYRWFVIPMVCWGAAVIVAAFQVDWQILVADILLIAGGLSAIGLGYWLLKLMTGERP